MPADGLTFPEIDQNRTLKRELGAPVRRIFHFSEIGTKPLLASTGRLNDGETGKNHECTAIMIVFRQNPLVV